MMLLLSATTALLIVLGFLVNGQVPFEMPISLLVQGSHPWAYPAILLSLTSTLGWYSFARYRIQGATGLLLPGLVCVLLVFLIFADCRVQPAHDGASAFLMFLSSVFLCHLSIELGHPFLRPLVPLSFVILPLVFSRNLTAIALVELALLSWALVILNALDHWPPRARDPEAVTLRELFRSGSRLRGYVWACYCVFFCGISGVYANAPLWALAHFGVCWSAGYLSRRYDPYLLVNYLLFLASGAGFIFVLWATVEVSVQSMVIPLFVIAGAVWLVATYRAQVAKLRA
jgi:hypothetical protein